MSKKNSPFNRQGKKISSVQPSDQSQQQQQPQKPKGFANDFSGVHDHVDHLGAYLADRLDEVTNEIKQIPQTGSVDLSPLTKHLERIEKKVQTPSKGRSAIAKVWFAFLWLVFLVNIALILYLVLTGTTLYIY